MSIALIKSCTCEHYFQDKLHGKGKRVHNTCKEGCRCTVCSKVKSVGKITKQNGVGE